MLAAKTPRWLLLALSWSFPLACDDKAADAEPDGTSDEVAASDDKAPKVEGPEVQSCTLGDTGCSEYRSEQFRTTQKTVKETCEQGGGTYATAACKTDNALGRCLRNKGTPTESSLVIYKVGTVTAEVAAASCQGGEWTPSP